MEDQIPKFVIRENNDVDEIKGISKKEYKKNTN